MRKNVASQVIGAQMVDASTGAAFSGSVTVYVTGNGGTQAAGSVGSGACTNEGNGFYTYAPAQAETDYDHVAFTFIGTGAVPATVQVYPAFPQTGDAFARLGAPVGASISADVAAVQADTDNIQTRLPAALVSGRMDASVGAVAADAITAASIASDAGTEIGTAVWATTTRVLTAGTNIALAKGTGVTGFNDLDAAGVRGAVGLAAANLDTQIGTLATASALAIVDDFLDTEVGSIKAKTDLIPASPAAVSDIPTAAAVADAVWDETLAAHTASGSTGEALSAAGGAGDPWITALPGSYTAGQAGYILGTNLDATISSRATQTSVDTVDGVVDAIKGKTDNLPASPAATGDIPTALQNADALLNRDMSAVTDSTARSPLNALRFIRNKWSISGTTLTVTKEDDTTSAWTATVTAAPGADPISGNDPT